MISIVLITGLFIGHSRVEAIEEFPSTENNERNSLETVNDTADNKKELEDDDKGLESSMGRKTISSYPDLGDDQVFPFVAGLDSYE